MNRQQRRAAASRLRAKQVGGVAVIDRTFSPDGACDVCSKHAELRPYGFNGEWLCFECAMKDEATTARKYREHVYGDNTH